MLDKMSSSGDSQNKTIDVVVVGSCITDFVTYAPRLPKCGETLFGRSFKTGFGGKGANQCVVASRLGARTAMVARVGSDDFGSKYIEGLKDNKVNTKNVVIVDDVCTGVAQITVDEQGNNAIVIVGGANLMLDKQAVYDAEKDIATSKVLVCQLEVPAETTLAALQLARKHGVTTILNPAPAQADLSPEFYKSCDIYCPNETEAELLLGDPITSVEEAKVAVGKLRDKGCQQVVITLGENGCVYGSQTTSEVLHIMTNVVPVVDTTGAGDAFVGALAFYLANETYASLSMEDKLRRSCHIAACSVQKEGTQSSYPWKKDIPLELLS